MISYAAYFHYKEDLENLLFWQRKEKPLKISVFLNEYIKKPYIIKHIFYFGKIKNTHQLCGCVF